VTSEQSLISHSYGNTKIKLAMDTHKPICVPVVPVDPAVASPTQQSKKYWG